LIPTLALVPCKGRTESKCWPRLALRPGCACAPCYNKGLKEHGLSVLWSRPEFSDRASSAHPDRDAMPAVLEPPVTKTRRATKSIASTAGAIRIKNAHSRDSGEKSGRFKQMNGRRARCLPFPARALAPRKPYSSASTSCAGVKKGPSTPAHKTFCKWQGGRSQSNQEEETMEPATVAVLAITAACLGFCVWIERQSRRRASVPEPSESVDVPTEVSEVSERRRKQRRHR
jgi:hypothetical protein